MRFYKFPKWQQWFYPNAIFDFFKTKCQTKKVIYLTFDDGPHPETTPLIIDILNKHKVKATFFCIGKNVKKHPELFQSIINNGHSVGNHSMNHINGFKTPTKKYVVDVLEANKLIKSNLFRPPFGKCTPLQSNKLNKFGLQTVFWSHLSYDFDKKINQTERYKKLCENSKDGSIIVFHNNLNSIEFLNNNLSKYIIFLKKMNLTAYSI